MRRLPFFPRFIAKQHFPTTGFSRFISHDKNLYRFFDNYIKFYGSMGVDTFVAFSLQHPKHGYYAKGAKIGGQGNDYITAPEVTSLFTEMIARWVKSKIEQKSYSEICLVELGPGNGTMMKYLIKSLNNYFNKDIKISIGMIEISSNQADIQFTQICEPNSVERSSDYYARPILKGTTFCGKQVEWYRFMSDIKYLPGPKIIIGNEFFDSLPPKQFMKIEDGSWREMLVSYDSDNKKFRFGLQRGTDLPPLVSTDPILKEYFEKRKWLEISMDALILWKSIIEELDEYGGDALIIDYGYTEAEVPDSPTLRAFYQHRQVDIMDYFGNCDITYDIDFPMLISHKSENTSISTPITQAQFLNSFGFEERANFLMNESDDSEKEKIKKCFEILTSPDQMGTRFKVITIEGT